MKLIETYFEHLRAKIDEIAADTEVIEQAAAICKEALTHGGVIHIFDSGSGVPRVDPSRRRAGSLEPSAVQSDH